MSDISKSWSRIKTWLDSNASGTTMQFQPAATDAELQSLEDAVGITLPEDLKDWLRIHNGCVEEISLFPSSAKLDLMGFSPMSAEEIEEAWTMLKELVDGGEFGDRTTQPDTGICTDWWNSSWVPFATNGGGDFQCVDLSPAEAGTTGQIISAWHDDDERHLIAPSLADYLLMLANGLERGKYAYDEDEGIYLDYE